jgi:NAD(P)-dependent dehydrogenase (short-subunit alcohol dehydrogenase family)
MRLEGRNALITGAGSGIGQSMAQIFAKEGANVAVNDLTEERTRETLGLLTEFGRKSIGVAADVTDFTAVGAMTNRVIKEFGRLDTLVCNAGIVPCVDLAQMTEQEWDRMIRVHLYGTFNCCRAAINHMLENRFGRIIITSSSSGIRGDPLLVHYSAAKAGQIGFARALSREVIDKGVTVNVVAPGLTVTPMLKDTDPKVIELNKPPIGRPGRPIDQAWAAVYFASDEAEYVSGQVINPNGGMF